MFKKIITISLYLYVSYFLFLPAVSAHLAGQPPVVKINGQFANLYHIPSSSVSGFELPQDEAVGNFLVNDPIDFSIEKGNLPAPPEVVEKTRFDWDFGDETAVQSGLELKHKFDKPGSYVVKVMIYDGSNPKPQLLDSIYINALPDRNYRLPKAVILVNGIETKDPLTDFQTLPFTKPINFDAGNSKNGSAQIISYYWDFGDLKSGSGKKIDHNYKAELPQVFPLLRVKDSNGFFVDTFVEVQNKNLVNQTGFAAAPGNNLPPVKTKQPASSQLPQTLLAIGVVVVLLLVARRFIFKKNKH